ncbi:MAG: histidine kinase N-terminal 7TM domain-containing protein [Methanomassiliicoccales archaeon]
MNETQFLALVPNAVCIVLSLVLAVRSYGKASLEHRRSFLATFFLIPMLALVLGAERFIGDPTTYSVLVVLEYAVSVCLLVAILSFSLCFTGHGRFVNRRNVAIVLAVGAAVVALNATNGLHHQFYRSFEILDVNGLHMLQPVYGPLFVAWLVYTVGILVFVMGWLLKAAGGMMGSKRTGTVLIVIGLGFYTFMGITNSILPRDPRLDMLTIGLTVASLLVFAANYKSSIIEQHGMTMDEALRDMGDGVVIEDPERRVIYMNDAARELNMADRISALDAIPAGGSEDVLWSTEEGDLEFSVSRSIIERGGIPIGTVTVLRDITSHKAVERRLALANHRLGTMGRALRHDIMNELTVLNGHLGLLSATEMTEKQKERLDKAQKAALRINNLIEKTREQHILDPVQPKWQDLEQAIRQGIATVEAEGVKVRTDVGENQVLADSMLSVVFGNLMDNSIRHGGGVKEISVTLGRRSKGTEIVWEDDGQGVPAEDKQRIFEKGYGKHTGMGLFLTRDILKITGMDIIEDGLPGKGARFVIFVPSASIRAGSKEN